MDYMSLSVKHVQRVLLCMLHHVTALQALLVSIVYILFGLLAINWRQHCLARAATVYMQVALGAVLIDN